LDEQKADLDVYFSSLSCDRATVIQAWVRIEAYRCFVPATASTAERQLYLSNMETLLGLELTEISGAAPGGVQSAPGMAILTIKEASELLRVPPRTLRLWAELGEVPAIKVGRQWRLRRRDIEEWLLRPINPQKNR
jgi:excisionase family DNA binding protein